MSAPLVLSAALAAAAVALLFAPGPARPRIGGDGRSARSSYLLVGSAAAIGCWLVLDRPALLAVVVIGVAAVLAGSRLVLRQRADREASRLRGRVVELCESLHAELAAGQAAPAALQRAASGWELLGPAARTATAGGDVPATLRRAARTPGAGDLRVVAAAWQVAHRTGHGLADAVAGVARELREADHTRRIVAGELASARATARLVAALPVLALLLGGSTGADPWGFLLGNPIGLACLAGGLALGLAGLAWIEALARDVERGR